MFRSALALLVLIPIVIQSQWIKQSNHNAGVHFVDKNHGWASSSSGELYKTVNGGIDWENIMVPKGLSKPHFIDQNFGFATSLYYEGPPYNRHVARIFKSTDGGYSWVKTRESLSFPGQVKSIKMIDKNTIWACYDTLFKSTNGGLTWEKKFWNDGAIKEVYFLNMQKGFLLTRTGNYYTTSDGGDNWESQNSTKFFSIDFISEEIGFAHHYGTTLKTIDGGATWEKLYSINIGVSKRIRFFNESKGLIQTESKFYKTLNGGKDWVELKPPAGSDFREIFEAVDMNNIWITTTNGIYKRDTTINLKIISPNRGETLYSNYQYEIRWGYLNLEGHYAKLEYSTDQGNTWDLISDSVKIETEKFLWQIPNIPSSEKCLIKISELAKGYQDISDSLFSIIQDTRKISITSPKAGEVYRNNLPIKITWDSNYEPGRLYLKFTYPGALIYIVTDSSRFIDMLPKEFFDGTTQVNIWDPKYPHIYAFSDKFRIKWPPRLYTSTSLAYRILASGSTFPISIISTNVEKIRMDYSIDGGTKWLLIDNQITADSNNSGLIFNYDWKIPNTPSKYCRVKLTSIEDSTVSLISGIFEITGNETIGKFPLEIGNKWFYKYWYSYSETERLEGIQAIWEVIDTVNLDDAKNYALVIIRHRADQNSFLFSTVDTCYIRQEKSNVTIRNPDPSIFYPSMNVNFSFFDFTNINGQQKSFRIGDDFSAHTIIDSIGFTTYNWRQSRHGYGGFASNLSGYILNGKIYGEILTNYIVGVDHDKELPTEYSLSQNYPNPFNPSTTIKYSIPFVETRHGASPIVLLKIYDVLGREITTLVNEEKAPGNYEVVFNGAYLPSGIYFYKMNSGNFSETKKLVLMK